MIPDGFGYRQQQNDSHVLLAAGAMILSILLHVVVLYCCSGWSVVNRVSRVRDLPSEERVPPMRVGVLTSDPITLTDEVKGERQKPAETPVDINSKVDALSQEVNPALTTPQPIAREALSPDTMAARMQPQSLDATPWMPRQEIAQIFDRKVQDEVATLPRLEIPLVERIQKAPDIVPSIDPSGRELGKTLEPLRPTLSTGPLSTEVVKSSFALPPPDSMEKDATLARFGINALGLLGTNLSNRTNAPIPEPDRPKVETLTKDEQKAIQAQEKIESMREKAAYQSLDDQLAARLQTYPDPQNPAQVYFLVSISPRADKPIAVIPKDIAFVQDVSGSISEERLRYCRRALIQEVATLNPQDRFTVVSFRSTLERCFPEWAAVTPENIDRASAFIGEMRSRGMTDIFGSLRALLTLPRDPRRPLIICLITDGKPTTGLMQTASIISEFSNLNRGMMSIYMYGTVNSANARLLNMLTYCNRGSASIASFFQWDISESIVSMCSTFRDPILSDVSVVFDSASRAEVYPRRTTNLYKSTSLEILGSCPADTQEVVLQIRGLAGEKAYDSVVRLKLSEATVGAGEIKTRWANQKMFHLASLYALNPVERRPLLIDMQNLGKQFNITPLYNIK